MKIKLPLAALCGLTLILGGATAQETRPTHSAHSDPPAARTESPTTTGKAPGPSTSAAEIDDLKRQVEELEHQNRALAQALAEISAKLGAKAGAQPPTAVAAGVRERRFHFEYKATVRGLPPGSRRLDLWLPVPHDNPHQKITSLRVDSPHPYQIRPADFGNRVLHLRLDDPAPEGFTLTMSFEVTRREHVQERLRPASSAPAGRPRPEPGLSRWLRPDRLVPLDDRIRGWAREVVEAAGAVTDLEKARAIYNHVVSTVKYDKSGQGWGRGDIYYACDARRGNCTDFHAIFIGYARAVGVPARFAIGFSLPAERGAGRVAGYHCWAEFYAGGVGWVPVDASEAAKDPSRREYYFGAHDENRVEVTRGRDVRLSPRQAGGALNYFVYPYAEVDGKAHAGVEKSFSFRDLPQTPAPGDVGQRR